MDTETTEQKITKLWKMNEETMVDMAEAAFNAEAAAYAGNFYKTASYYREAAKAAEKVEIILDAIERETKMAKVN